MLQTNYKSQRQITMQIRVYDKHESTDEEEMYTSYMVLGVHSFAHFLADFAHRKNVKIFIQGNPAQVIQNILWNQYFSYTLLKDIEKTIFAQAQHRNSFLKTSTKTYRLSQCIEWQQFQKQQNLILKNQRFCLESFMTDSSIKYVTIQISSSKNRNDYDLEFQYMTHSLSLSSFSLNSNKKIQTYSVGSKTTNNIENCKQSMMQKSFQGKCGPAQPRNTSSIKYSTEKKASTNKAKRGNVQTGSKKQDNKQKKTAPSLWKENNNEALSFKSSINNYTTHSTRQPVESDFLKKQNIAAAILHRKEDKIKQYMILLEQKQKEYEDQLAKTEARHEEEVTQIKQQVQQVLSSYKKKNKNLRKQNECLTEMNRNLTIANQKLEQTMSKLSSQMQTLKQKQQTMQSDNKEYRVKLENIQNANIALNEKLNKQESVFKSQIGEKTQMASELKTKYNKLLGSIKNVAIEVDKENLS